MALLHFPPLPTRGRGGRGEGVEPSVCITSLFNVHVPRRCIVERLLPNP